MSYWKEKKGELTKKIERKKQELMELYEKEGLSSKKIARLNQDIDKLICEFYLTEKRK